MAPEAKTFLCIDLLPSTSNGLTVPIRRGSSDSLADIAADNLAIKYRPATSVFRFDKPFYSPWNSARKIRDHIS
jgi:hypothetical protein